MNKWMKASGLDGSNGGGGEAGPPLQAVPENGDQTAPPVPPEQSAEAAAPAESPEQEELPPLRPQVENVVDLMQRRRALEERAAKRRADFKARRRFPPFPPGSGKPPKNAA